MKQNLTQRKGASWRLCFLAALLVATAGLAGNKIVRKPAVAGSFYPEDPKKLSAEVDERLSKAPTLGVRGTRAVLVPHAGYIFSASTAAAGFKSVDKGFTKIFLMAGNHSAEADFVGISLPDETHYAIPGAEIPIDTKIIKALKTNKIFVSVPAANAMHMIEVELPFLKAHLTSPDFQIIPMVAGRLDLGQAEKVADVLAKFADKKTLFVFSSDLSHYHKDEEARRLDSTALDAIMARNPPQTMASEACGNQALGVLVAMARKLGWEPTFLAYSNSGDANGDKSRVVGYAAVAFHDKLEFSKDERQAILDLARRSVDQWVRKKEKLSPAAQDVEKHPILKIPRGVFVTLKKKGELRGCIGELKPRQNLSAEIVDKGIAAASQDPRFPPVKPEELKDIAVSVSVLDYPQLVTVNDPKEYLKVLKPKVDGVIIDYQGNRSTFLPQVWEDIPDPQTFLTQLCLKQGAPKDCWQSKGTQIYRYRGIEIL